MYTEYDLRQVPLSLKSARRSAEEFLASNELRLDDVDYLAAIYRLEEDEMLACGGLKGNLLKCIAVSEKLRDTGMSSRLISHLVNLAFQDGYSSVKVFTKPKNREIFSSLGFQMLASAPKAILMESSLKGIQSYQNYLSQQSREGKNGVIVMNCNPFTKGHRYLIETASKQVDNLYIIPVKEDRSLFSYQERKSMLEKGTEDLENVYVLEGSEYSISQFTFPTYFLKDLNDAADTHITLDLSLFANFIAPALKAKVRFVGSEPKDILTQRYNELMHRQLPPLGIEVCEIQRVQDGEEVVSASSLRNALKEWNAKKAFQLAHPSTIPFLLGHLASQALQTELDTTPKPGLVDKANNGAHRDMDHALMTQSIKALHPFFVEIAVKNFRNEPPLPEELKEVGLRAEESMFRNTHGINTHKGALFAMGLLVACSAHLMRKEGKISKGELQRSIQEVALKFTSTKGTHGTLAQENHGAKGALLCAQEGYPELFQKWIPYCREHRNEEHLYQKLLLLIMSTLDDTNILHRVGLEKAREVKQEAISLWEDFSILKVEEMDKKYTLQNISPGGSADMLSLTLLGESVVE